MTLFSCKFPKIKVFIFGWWSTIKKDCSPSCVGIETGTSWQAIANTSRSTY